MENFITKKCPECGAVLNVAVKTTYADMCDVLYSCNCGWWVCINDCKLKEVMEEEDE